MLKHLSLIVLLFYTGLRAQTANERFVSYTTTPAAVTLYWKDASGQPLRSLQNLKQHVEKNKRKLVFGMNAGMYQTDYSPLGLYIEQGKTRHKLNTRLAPNGGNFYMMPNGVFYTTTDNKAVVCTTQDFKPGAKIKYATQSGPMLLIDGAIHPTFQKGSSNLNIRNGVGILPDGRVVFAVSKNLVNFYDFAQFFADLGCKNALYLDGFVSRAYVPDQNWTQLDGDFGVMIGVTE